MSDWRDIASAPKDGTRIWLKYVYDVGGPKIVVGWWNGKRWESNAPWEMFEPKHWMPLPTPPEQEK